MNHTYGRLVSRAAIAATVMASLLLLIKIFAWWYTGSVSILAALVDSLANCPFTFGFAVYGWYIRSVYRFHYRLFFTFYIIDRKSVV